MGLNRDKINLLDKIQSVAGKTKSVIQGLNKRQAQETLEVSRKNWIINGDFQVSQRGDYTSATTTTVQDAYYLDRWQVYDSTIASDVQDTAGAMKLICSTGGTGAIQTYQKIENYALLAGKTLTMSALIRTNINGVCFNLYDGTTENLSNKIINDGNWQYLTFTHNLRSDASICRVGVTTNHGGFIAIGVGDYFEIKNVKLEIGDTATPFEVEPYAEVLRKCQRYYYKEQAVGLYSSFGNGSATSTANLDISSVIRFPVEMRTAPSLSYSALGDFAVVNASGSTVGSVESFSILYASAFGTSIRASRSTSTDLTQGAFYYLSANNTVSAALQFEAEL